MKYATLLSRKIPVVDFSILSIKDGLEQRDTTLKRLFVGLLFMVILIGLLSSTMLPPTNTYALYQTPTPEEEYRRTTNISVDYIAHEWWLVRWKNNEITCRFMRFSSIYYLTRLF